MKKIICLFMMSWLLTSFCFAADFNVATTQEFRAALANSAGNGESDSINLAAGTYKTTDDGLGTFTFLDNEDFDLTLQGVSADTTILSGDNQSRVLNFNVVGSNASIVVKNIKISDGVTTENGGGIFSEESITLQDCKLFNNRAENGGGLWVERFTTLASLVEGSVFKDNIATNQGGAMRFNYGTIDNSIFTDNQGGLRGGAIVMTSGMTEQVTITNSTFTSNTANTGGAIFNRKQGVLIIDKSIFSSNAADSSAAIEFNKYSTVTSLVINSIFHNNVSNELNDPSHPNKEIFTVGQEGSTPTIDIVNSAFIKNSGGVRFAESGEQSSIINTVFVNNSESDVVAENSHIPTIQNSYVPSIQGPTFNEDVITTGDLGFVDITNNDFRLTSASVLIDSGKVIETLGNKHQYGNYPERSFPFSDIAGNQRIAGTSIDIGPYEFSTTRPTVTKFDVEGTRKVNQVLSFVTDATASSGRTITSYEIDNGSGAFVSASSEFDVTYLTSGQRLVRVKVTDDQGEWSTKSLTISIADLTLDEKIVAATEAGRQEVINSPSTYGLALASEIPVAREAGRQEVINSPSTYGLALASEIPVAREAGRQDVISSPSTYDLALASEIPVAREEQIAACLAIPSSCGIQIPNADIDGNGTQDALTDGLLILRYSFGLTGDSLISGVVGAGATRTTAEDIEAYLATLMP